MKTLFVAFLVMALSLCGCKTHVTESPTGMTDFVVGQCYQLKKPAFVWSEKLMPMELAESEGIVAPGTILVIRRVDRSPEVGPLANVSAEVATGNRKGGLFSVTWISQVLKSGYVKSNPEMLELIKGAEANRFPGVFGFHEREIRSKSWRDEEGHTFKLLKWSVFDLPAQGEPRKFLVAQFGDDEAREATCLEFYRVDQIFTSEGKEGEIFTLLMHDDMGGIVTAVEVEPKAQDNSDIHIRVTRETSPSATRNGREIYWFGYSLLGSMGQVPRAFYYDLPVVILRNNTGHDVTAVSYDRIGDSAEYRIRAGLSQDVVSPTNLVVRFSGGSWNYPQFARMHESHRGWEVQGATKYKFQIEKDGAIYLLPSKTQTPLSGLPEQPEGFPLRAEP